MPFFNYPQVWTRQPQYAVNIDWGNPLAAGLRNCYHFHPRWNWRRDLVTGAQLTLSTNGSISAAGFQTAGTVLEYLSFPLSFNAIPPLTLLIGMRYISGVVPWSILDSSGWTGIYGAGSEPSGCASTNSASFDGVMYPSLGPGTDPNGITYYAFTMGGANDLRGSANGGSVASDTSCAAPAGTIGYFRLGCDYSGYNNSAVVCKYAAVFQRAMPDAELRELSANPWQLFAPLQRRIWIGGATGAPTNYPLTADVGSYAYTGVAAGLKKGNDLVTVTGTYTYTGQAVNLLWKRVLAAAAGTYAETGVAVNLTKQWKLTAAAGTYNYTGIDVTPIYSGDAHPPLAAAVGTYDYTGVAANLIWKRVIIAAAGSYIETGIDVNLKKGNVLPLAAGTYDITGVAATLKRTYVLTAENGVYSYIGLGGTNNVRLNWSGAPGSTVAFYQGVSKVEGVTLNSGGDNGVSLTTHEVTPTGGGTYTVTKKSGVSDDKTDSPNYEGYVIT